MSDSNSIWNWNSTANLEPFRRLSLRSNSTSLTTSTTQPTSQTAAALAALSLHHQQSNANTITSSTGSTNSTKSTCSWHPSSDNKYLVGYIVISRQDLDFYQHGFQLRGDKQTRDGQYGAILEHVTPGSLVNIICKLKVGDEIVEWNGFDLRNKSNEEVNAIVESSKNAQTLRIVAVRYVESTTPTAAAATTPPATTATATTTTTATAAVAVASSCSNSIDNNSVNSSILASGNSASESAKLD